MTYEIDKRTDVGLLQQCGVSKTTRKNSVSAPQNAASARANHPV